MRHELCDVLLASILAAWFTLVQVSSDFLSIFKDLISFDIHRISRVRRKNYMVGFTVNSMKSEK